MAVRPPPPSVEGRECPHRLMAVPEPADKAFVERVKQEVAEARVRCLNIFAPETPRNDHQEGAQ
jgi:hypothetical protein